MGRRTFLSAGFGARQSCSQKKGDENDSHKTSRSSRNACITSGFPVYGGREHLLRYRIARPPRLFHGQQGKQRTEIHFDPATGTVTVKLLVQDPNGYFIPGIRRENFAVYVDGVRQDDVGSGD